MGGVAKFRLAPVAYDGWKFIIGFLFVGAAFLLFDLWFSRLVGVALLFLGAFSILFFRDPDREPDEADAIVSPGDGVVMETVRVDGEGYGKGHVIRIFLSVFDVHVQRSPVPGKVSNVKYVPGLFLDARDARAAFANENNSVEIQTARGRVVVRQIAGLIARRIVCWAREGDELALGERIGLIRFGSQVDLYLPDTAEPAVKDGDRVVGGKTVVARWTAGSGRQGAKV